ncbi:MAG: UxaA family hydrolase [Rhodospirillales bacterium]|nr:UxaA family hydrolase [Rhodospirillales bacterium]
MPSPDFLVHHAADTVGVVVVENIVAGQKVTGWIMENNKTIKVKCLDTIPIGHKIALAPMSKGDTVLKYGHDIGKVVGDIVKGAHVHTQNLKTKRW